MINLVLLAASASVFSVAAPQHSITVDVVGRARAQVEAEIVRAAVKLCRAESEGSLISDQLQAACVARTTRESLRTYLPRDIVSATR
jgi:hypothetical protein